MTLLHQDFFIRLSCRYPHLPWFDTTLTCGMCEIYLPRVKEFEIGQKYLNMIKIRKLIIRINPRKIISFSFLNNLKYKQGGQHKLLLDRRYLLKISQSSFPAPSQLFPKSAPKTPEPIFSPPFMVRPRNSSTCTHKKSPLALRE